MDSSPHGIIIKVENLNICRSFYRDILGLGDPVMDSNFWVEFRLNNNMSLILEKIEEGENLSVKKSRVSWLYHVGNLNQMIQKLKNEDVELLDEEKERIGCKVVKYCDPEGNPFYIYT